MSSSANLPGDRYPELCDGRFFLGLDGPSHDDRASGRRHHLPTDLHPTRKPLNLQATDTDPIGVDNAGREPRPFQPTSLSIRTVAADSQPLQIPAGRGARGHRTALHQEENWAG